ncbi:DUF5060 domain-containing protein [Fulvivirgaceae bacterium BMA12]|uniref:DUF5060 domain-containing protein n=1 Tax=Agaribacillus aureus TaxID=3051825 RepID=A0ABT8LBR3_9BACT|nr:DUF5060 domain-containing protein [Fulvivirgaceae bacterium BMA12]
MSKSYKISTLLSLAMLCFISTAYSQKTLIQGELKKWHKVTLLFHGPQVSEQDAFNPFMNYRLNVNFTHAPSGKKYLVPGHFAADGEAANSSATSGNKWRVYFAPDEEGEWRYEVTFRKGTWVAVSDRDEAGGSGGFMDEEKGTFTVLPTDKTGRDLRAKGRLQYVGEPYLKFGETGEYFLKCGADAPENFLAYAEFDGNFQNDGHKDELVKNWEAHVKHWNEGDPTWQNGKGKGIIGAVNYLAGKGMNVFSFLTNNIEGDDRNVFPYTDYNTYDHFDVSKLDQWEIIFEHADKLGMFLHFKTLEVENQGLLDGGGVGANTKLYYRELISRFGHHLALNWNLGEENGEWMKKHPTPPQFTWQRLSMAAYFHDHDPYKHHIVIHNGNQFYDLLGPESHLTGISYQTHKPDFSTVHKSVLRWRKISQDAGKVWAIAVDEPGDAQHSLLPDSEDPAHDDARKNGLWGALMAGAWGTEWYFGYKHPHSDLTCQDYASRDLFWDQGRHALKFFQELEVPFWEMENHNELISNKDGYCFAKPGSTFVVYLKNGGTSDLELDADGGTYTITWFNPRTGKVESKPKSVEGKGKLSIGLPPVKKERQEDWVALVRKKVP